jgi:hypothetical protein
MTILVRGKKFFLRGDIWFDCEPEETPNVDVLYYYYQQIPPSIPGIESDEEYTLLIDLTKTQDELWKNLSKNTRHKIRQASNKDRFVYEFWDRVDSNVLNDFSDFYSRFASQQGLAKWSGLEISRLKSYADAGVLNFSHVKTKEGNSLIWRVYYRGEKRVVSLHSALIRNSTDASYNQMLGRANRYDRWQDILTFKNLGVLIYDLGGWYANTTDPKLLNINKFKESFGGKLVRNFNCRQGITAKGKLFLLSRKILLYLLLSLVL